MSASNNNTIEENKRIIMGYNGSPIRIMEVCGTHTHEIFALGIRTILPPAVRLISGPGCPVCVTPVSFIDEAVMLAMEKHCVITTFGDLVRVPGSDMSLAQARSQGATIEVVYSPLDALDYAAVHNDRDVVFLSVGFETTTPASCIAVEHAATQGVTNFSILTANKTMDNAYPALRDSADAFLYPGHVSVMTGCGIYKRLCNDGVSGVVAGFTAEEILDALATIIKEVPKHKPFFHNCYPRVVNEEGNTKAREIVARTMQPTDAEWRGLGVIKGSGLQLRGGYDAYNARVKYALPHIEGRPNKACRCGDVLRGDIMPSDCPCFGRACTPEKPVGACMVSSEGACAAFYKYGM